MPGTSFPSPSSQNYDDHSDSVIRSPQQRKEALRNVYNNAQALTGNLNVNTLRNLEELINEVDSINNEGTLEDKIKDQGVVILDSEIMSLSSQVLKKYAYSLSKNISCYDADEYAEKIKLYVRGLPGTLAYEGPNYSLLTQEVMKCFKRTPIYAAVLGTLRRMPKKEIVRRKIVREKQGPMKKPEKVITLEKTEESVEDTVMEIKKIIYRYQRQHKKPLDFFALVLHPTDFGKTIENILHTSFLVKDCFIKFTMDEDGVPQVYTIRSEETEKAKEDKTTKNIQNVLSLSMKEWKALVEAYDIKEPMINITAANASKK
ncbi:non-structural maintenance of chromosomes element 4 homolog A isoform X1 [Nasonia vitripennis]|uniref:Non-structural maintenance of chromosomes element 4 n=1 Tax=Nasonia vitripennis TaxID=7425 RepID=A0A7M7G788_NASVI|nr:non-structural maintenance of chromosomes element 4 homolog A isoform X1 [Nasonia vitripennis]